MSEWKNVKNYLPRENKHYLGFCHNEYDNGYLYWKGLIEVQFDPSTGWSRCEVNDENPIRVLYWRDLPELPPKDEE